jgi:hypothetical protein
MTQASKIEVLNRQGWRKEFEIEKPIIQIGRDQRNDIVLDDGSDATVEPRHAQLLPSTVNRQGLRLVNLSNSIITVFARNEPAGGPGVALAPRAATEIASGDRAKIGEFTLTLYGAEQRSEMVQLSIELPSKELLLDRPLAGGLTIRHVGDKAAVQFKIALDGLEPEHYELGPGPLLFPNAEKQLAFRLHHPNRPFPKAGLHRITFQVTAPDAYPGEIATISCDLDIAPFYRHKMRMVVMDLETTKYHLG